MAGARRSDIDLGGIQGLIARAILRIVSRIPRSRMKAARTPRERAKALTLHACSRSALASGTLALPPGPFGLVTILPDLLAIWRIQRQLVADIAAVYGKTSHLGREQMLYCLFRHAAGQAVRDVVVRAGERFLVRPASARVLQGVLRRLGVSVTERAAGRAASRWLPLAGAVGIGAYAFYDTAQVGKTAMAFFEKEIVIDSGGAVSGEAGRA